MVQKLSERCEELLRQFLTDNIRPAEIQGYDPNQSNSDASDFMPITTDWSDWGSTYPKIVVQENNGPTIPGGGQTNYTGLQGDGSGVNQYAIHNITLSVQAKQDGDYLNSTEYDDLLHDIFEECRYQCRSNASQGIAESQFIGDPGPPVQTRSTEETDSGSTLTWVQRQSTVPVGVQYEP